MALMRAYIDKRTVTSIASNANTTYAHGLPGTPDTVLIRYVASQASTTAWVGGISALVDVSNVTIQNCGRGGSGNLELCAIAFHSIIQ